MEERLKRKKGESDESYQIRLTLMKQSGVDLDWSEIAELVGDGRSHEAYRKDSYGIRRYHNSMGKINDNEVLLEIKKEKVKLNDLRTLVNKEIRELSRYESMIDLLKENIENLSDTKPLLSEFKIKETPSGNDMVVMLSDVHLGLEFTHDINSYSPEICIERLNTYADKIISISKLHNVDKIHICCLGDLCGGEIHNTLRLQNRLNLSEQIIEIVEIISEFVNKIANNTNYVTVSICNGNHERIYEKDNNLNKDNYTLISKYFIKNRCKAMRNVSFLDNTFNNDEIIHLNIKGYDFLGCHGDKINKSKVNEQLRNITNINPQYVIIGHFHHPSESVNGNCVIYQNGSVVGSDEYSLNKKLVTEPQQKVLIVTMEGVGASYNIKL